MHVLEEQESKDGQGDKVGLKGGGVESAADDLLDLSGVEVDARAEEAHFL